MSMKIFNSDKFSQDLKEYRKNGKIKQVELANSINTNRSTLSNFETKKQLPSFEILNEFCNIYNSKPSEYFIEEAQDPILYMMGKFLDSDKQKLEDTISEIMICERYYELNKRCQKR